MQGRGDRFEYMRQASKERKESRMGREIFALLNEEDEEESPLKETEGGRERERRN